MNIKRLLVATILFASSPIVLSSQITVTYTGQLTNIYDEYFDEEGIHTLNNVTLGTTFMSTVIYDDSSSPLSSTSNNAEYPVIGMTMQIGNHIFTQSLLNPDEAIGVANDRFPLGNPYVYDSISSFMSTDSITAGNVNGGFESGDFFLLLENQEAAGLGVASPLNSTSLVNLPYNLALWPIATLTADIYNNEGWEANYEGTITGLSVSVTAVPVPPSLLLFISGFALLVRKGLHKRALP